MALCMTPSRECFLANGCLRRRRSQTQPPPTECKMPSSVHGNEEEFEPNYDEYTRPQDISDLEINPVGDEQYSGEPEAEAESYYDYQEGFEEHFEEAEIAPENHQATLPTTKSSSSGRVAHYTSHRAQQQRQEGGKEKTPLHHIAKSMLHLEHGDDDPVGFGDEFLREVKDFLAEKGLYFADEKIYAMISMADNKKFLFDGRNMIRVHLHRAVKNLFSMNPYLFGRLKQFIRDKARSPQSAP